MEEKFKVGDWVVWKPTGYVGRIWKPCDSFPNSWNINLKEKNLCSYDSCSEVNLRKATPKEARTGFERYFIIRLRKLAKV